VNTAVNQRTPSSVEVLIRARRFAASLHARGKSFESGVSANLSRLLQPCCANTMLFARERFSLNRALRLS
jgi:hypothetical protein